MTNERISGIPIVVLGNKIDLPGSASEGELREALGLLDTSGKDVSDSNFDFSPPAFTCFLFTNHRKLTRVCAPLSCSCAQSSTRRVTVTDSNGCPGFFK